MRSTGTPRTTLFSASLVALALLLPVSTQAQSSGNGLTKLIDSNVFYDALLSSSQVRSST